MVYLDYIHYTGTIVPVKSSSLRYETASRAFVIVKLPAETFREAGIFRAQTRRGLREITPGNFGAVEPG